MEGRGETIGGKTIGGMIKPGPGQRIKAALIGWSRAGGHRERDQWRETRDVGTNPYVYSMNPAHQSTARVGRPHGTQTMRQSVLRFLKVLCYRSLGNDKVLIVCVFVYFLISIRIFRQEAMLSNGMGFWIDIVIYIIPQ